MKYDPHWPFPQYDENGKQLLPPNHNKRQRKQPLELEDYEESPL